MALIIPENWCLIFFRDAEGMFDSSRLRQVLIDARLSVSGEEKAFTVRWGDGPAMLVSVSHGKSIETVLRGLVRKEREYRDLLAGCDAQIKIEINDLDEALDEINTLIELQSTLQAATNGLMYNAWNQRFSAPEPA